MASVGSHAGSLLGAATELVGAGWKVFPCHESDGPHWPAKSPYTRRGHLDATDDLTTIRAWCTRWPDALIGATVPESLLVIDIDPRNGGSRAALIAVVGELPPTTTVWSGREDGGHHLYYLRPPGAVTSTRLPTGIDLKASGYMIMPPSIHPATRQPYRWELHPFAPLPPRLRELLRPVPPPVRTFRASTCKGAPLVRFVERLPEGQRNSGLFWAACRAAEDGVLDFIATALVQAVVADDFPEREASRVLASARRIGARP